MGEWLSKMLNALSGQSDGAESVRKMLRVAQRDRVRLALESTASPAPGLATAPRSGGGRTIVLTSIIEQVRNDDLVISQPSIGGLTHPLAFGEEFRLNYVHQSLYHTGKTRCLGRIKVPSGVPDQMLFAYRLSLPEELHVENRRAQPRVQIAFDQKYEAQLYASASGDGPLFGTVLDVSMTGARIGTQSHVGRIAPRQSMFLKAMLPEPVGLVDELVDVVRIDFDARTQQHRIAVSFRKRVEGLELLIRAAQSTPTMMHRKTG